MSAGVVCAMSRSQVSFLSHCTMGPDGTTYVVCLTEFLPTGVPCQNRILYVRLYFQFSLNVGIALIENGDFYLLY